jgi:hypothetical protein
MNTKYPYEHLTCEGATVKVMNSHDYGHFEVSLVIDGPVAMGMVDALRKDAQRLVDRAIDQYKTARKAANARIKAEGNANGLRREVHIFRENYPQSEWTPEQKAKVKALEDYDFMASRVYNYEDDWPEDFCSL